MFSSFRELDNGKIRGNPNRNCHRVFSACQTSDSIPSKSWKSTSIKLTQYRKVQKIQKFEVPPTSVQKFQTFQLSQTQNKTTPFRIGLPNPPQRRSNSVTHQLFGRGSTSVCLGCPEPPGAHGGNWGPYDGWWHFQTSDENGFRCTSECECSEVQPLRVHFWKIHRWKAMCVCICMYVCI